METAIGAERDGDHISYVVQVGEEKVAVLVERQARITTGGAQVVVVPDQSRGPCRAAIEAHGLKHASRRKIHVRDNHNVLGVGRVDGHGLLRLVGMPLADIDVRRHRVVSHWFDDPSGASQNRDKRGDPKN